VTLITGSAGIGKTTLAVQFILEGTRLKEPGLYVTLEEGPAQVLESSAALRLPLKEAVADGIVEVAYLSRTHIRASQLLAILTEKIEAYGVRRIAIDSVSHIEGQGLSAVELRELLYDLTVRFKALGVTSLMTLESASMLSLEPVTERGLSPIADNLIGLRYRAGPHGLERTLTIVKARASVHDMKTHLFTIGEGGLRLGDALDSTRKGRST
jgi:circadian clock protein KaiC